MLGCTALGATIAGRKLFASDGLVEAIRADESGSLLRLAAAVALVPPLLLALSLASQMVRNGLYERGEASLTLTTPVPSGGLPQIVFVRVVVSGTLFGVALAAPCLLSLLESAELPQLASLLAIPAVVIALAPLAAFVVGVQILLLRFLATPRVKLAVQGVTGLMGTAFAVLAMFGFLASDDDTERLVLYLEEIPRAPALLDVPAAIVLAGAGKPLDPATLLYALALLAAGPLVLYAMGPLYRRVFENSMVAAPPVLAPSRRRGWPTTVARSVLARDVAGCAAIRGASSCWRSSPSSSCT